MKSKKEATGSDLEAAVTSKNEDEQSNSTDSFGFVQQEHPEVTITHTGEDLLPKEMFKDEDEQSTGLDSLGFVRQDRMELAIVGMDDDVSTLANDTFDSSIRMLEIPGRGELKKRSFKEYKTPSKNKSSSDDGTAPETPPSKILSEEDDERNNSFFALGSTKFYQCAGVLGCVLLASIGALSYALIKVRSQDSSSSTAGMSNWDHFTFPPVPSPGSLPKETAAPVTPTAAPVTPTAAPVTLPTMDPTTNLLAVTIDDFSSLLANRSLGSLEILEDMNSPQYESFEWVTNDLNYFDYGPDRAIQRWVLGVFFLGLSEEANSTSPANLTLWMTDADECSWYSTRTDSICNEDGLFRNLDLRGLDLYGTIPAELSLLSGSLEQIMLPDNNLGGTIPSELGELSLLVRLRLSSNLLVGAVPSELGRLTNLEVLSLDRNDHNGTIPTDLGNLPKLDTLGLEGNNFTGKVSSEICELRDQALNLFTVECDDVSCDCCNNCVPCNNEIRVTKDCFATEKNAESITLTFSNCDPRGDDWIGLYRDGVNPNALPEPLLWAWTCGDQSCAGATRQGSVTLNHKTLGENVQWPLVKENYKVFLIRQSAPGVIAESQTFKLKKNKC